MLMDLQLKMGRKDQCVIVSVSLLHDPRCGNRPTVVTHQHGASIKQSFPTPLIVVVHAGAAEGRNSIIKDA